MTYVPHYRLSLLGDMPDGEMFSCNLSLRPDNSEWSAAVGAVAQLSLLTNWLADDNDGLFPDIVDDCEAFWASPNTEVSQRVVLKRVKMAAIDANGHYAASPREAAVNVPGGRGTGFGEMFPHQVSRKVTLETNADLGRVKGGFYLPGVTSFGHDATTNLTSVEVTGLIRDKVADFISAINNAPGLDSTAVKVVIASQGRRNSDGTLRVPPGNHDVERVNVGRRVDVQRRRANKLVEARLADAVI